MWRSPERRRSAAAAGLALVATMAAACGASTGAAPDRGSTASVRATQPRGTTGTTAPAPTTGAAQSPNHRMFAFYYLWWDTAHWHARLGPRYPYSVKPLPLPATLAGDGCSVTNNYPGNQLTDVATPLFTQNSQAQITNDVRSAAGAGLAGFAVGWEGTGHPNQTASSSAFDRRLAMVVRAVNQLRRSGGTFSLWIAYMSSASIRTASQMNNDLAYLTRTYANNPAFDHSNGGKPTLVMMGSRKYPQPFLDAFSARWRPHYYLVGDENWKTWDARKAADFDADQYYWSSQNPVKNPASFNDLQQLAKEVRSSRNPNGSAKQFFAPLAPGYNKILGGGSGCVPRLNGQTMRDLYSGNAVTAPNGWMVISWNEIDEGTYIMPLERYGTRYIDTLRSIIEGPATP